MTFHSKYRLCKKGHLLLPNNVIWSKLSNGKHQRACRKCCNERRKHDPKRIERNRIRNKIKAAKKRAQKLQHLNATGIIMAHMHG